MIPITKEMRYTQNYYSIYTTKLINVVYCLKDNNIIKQNSYNTKMLQYFKND